MKTTKQFLPKVTFIIPTLNASYYLPSCLSAIRNQLYPQKLIEIIVADGNSTDSTIKIAKKYRAKIINNPEILHEPGKAIASELATGQILFFTDADNILSHKNWLQDIIRPYLKYPQITGFMPQTLPAPNSHSLDRYMGYLSTDPFTWFVYGYAASPRTYGQHYQPLYKSPKYQIYRFSAMDHPLFGLSQGFGTIASFKRQSMAHSDDILAGIKLIQEGGLIVYVPSAGIYHYHIKSWADFINKYTWRIRNNFYQKVSGMGLRNRQHFLNLGRKIRQYLFVPYSISIVFPIYDTIRLFKQYRDPVVLWHPIACLVLAILIIKELSIFLLGIKRLPGIYGKRQ